MRIWKFPEGDLLGECVLIAQCTSKPSAECSCGMPQVFAGLFGFVHTDEAKAIDVAYGALRFRPLTKSWHPHLAGVSDS